MDKINRAGIGFLFLFPLIAMLACFRGDAISLLFEMPRELAGETGSVTYVYGYLLVAFALLLPVMGLVFVISAFRRPHL